MPTSTNVTNLKINELTEAQYDAAVQGGIIGANEISILTDAEAGQVIQVTTMPTASATEEGKIYQFVGTTDANYTNGYFYKCEGAGSPVVYSWTRVDVQPTPSGLPSQTGNAGKFLTTDGTDASWSDKPIINKAVQSSSVVVNTNPDSTTVQASGQYNTMLGYGARVNNSAANYNTIIGHGANVSGSKNRNVIIGYGAESYADNCVTVGNNARANATNAIQIGNVGGDTALNSDANTMKVANANGNFEIMSADGTIPTARLTKVNTTITLTSAGWSSNTQTVNVTGMTATGVVMVSPDPTDQSAYTSAGIICSAQAAGTLTFTCDSTPSNDIDVVVVMM